MLKYGLLNERFENIHFGYGTPLYAFEDMATTWENMGMGALNGSGGMNYVAREVYYSDHHIPPEVFPLVFGGTVGILTRNFRYGVIAYEWADAFRGGFIDDKPAAFPLIPYIDPLINPPKAE